MILNKYISVFFLLFTSAIYANSLSFNREHDKKYIETTDELQSFAIARLINDLKSIKHEVSTLKKELASLEMSKKEQNNSTASLYIVTVFGANVREKPDIGAKVITFLSKNSIFELEKKEEEWLKIKNSGYIHKSIVKQFRR